MDGEKMTRLLMRGHGPGCECSACRSARPMSSLYPYGRPFGPGHKPDCPCNYCAQPNGAPPIVCLPLMRIPAPPEKPTKYLPEVWKPTEDYWIDDDGEWIA